MKDSLAMEFTSGTVLIVEDEFINQQVVMAVVQQNGYSSRLARSGEEAMEILENFEPDLVLLDLLLPGMDGFTVVKKIKQKPEMQAVPVILVTALNDKASRLAGLQAGAEDFVSKPIDPQELGIRIRNLMRLKKLNDFLKAHNLVLAQYDTLTGLPNGSLFRDRLIHDIAAGQRSGGEVGIFVLYLNNLKRVNDTFGLAAGDELLRMVTERLTACTSEGDMVARLTGGEFAIALRRPQVEEEMLQLSRSLLETLGRPIFIGHHEIFLAFSLGGSRSPRDASDMEELLRKGGVALTQAKLGRRNTFIFYSPEMDGRDRDRITLETRLHYVLARHELQLYYQPKVECTSGRIVGMEALVRWFSPELGMISPAQFIPLSEETELIIPIGEWVLREACRQTRLWRDGGFPLQVSVNLSVRQFLQRGLSRMVGHALNESGLDPAALELEITESCAIGDVHYSIGLIRDLRNLGISCALDDFGTGYSSLNHLKQLPIHTVKLDQSFLRHVPGDRNDAKIVRAVIGMAHDLDLKVVAEGVEEKEQLLFLKEQRCDYLQGYYFSRPLPANEFADLLKKRRDVPWDAV